MEISYEHGELVTEPVMCPDGYHLKLRWWDSYDTGTNENVPGVEIMKCRDPKDFLGTGAWYSLGDLRQLGDGKIQKGIDVIGQEWYRIANKDLYTIRPLNDVIKELNQSLSQ